MTVGVSHAERPQQPIPRHITDAVLARNTLWNLLGLVAPLLAGVFALPPLIRGLGLDRFGLLSIAWVVVGYFSLFDLGLGRALTQSVAAAVARGKAAELPTVIWTGLELMLLLGLIGGALLAGAAPLITQHFLRIPEYLRSEATQALFLLGVSVPIVTVTAGLRGVLEGMQRFELVNAIRVPQGVLTFVGPLLVLLVSSKLPPTVLSLVAVRLIALAGYVVLCRLTLPSVGRPMMAERTVARSLFRFGGWMTVSNVISPLMVNFDRVVIGALLSMAAVTFYSTPFEVVTKLLLIPGAAASVLFPAFTSIYSLDRRMARDTYYRALAQVALVMVPLVALLIIFARFGLLLWLGPDFARESTTVTRFLVFGVLINGLAAMPFAMIQAIGRADLTAKLHLVELPVYATLLVVCTHFFGITGAAIAWSIRVSIDALLLFRLTSNLLTS